MVVAYWPKGVYNVLEVAYNEIKRKLSLLRKQNGYSQEQLADKSGVARQTYSTGQ